MHIDYKTRVLFSVDISLAVSHFWNNTIINIIIIIVK
jgi:hypothetical protein